MGEKFINEVLLEIDSDQEFKLFICTTVVDAQNQIVNLILKLQ